jgi:hypothetical protein
MLLFLITPLNRREEENTAPSIGCNRSSSFKRSSNGFSGRSSRGQVNFLEGHYYFYYLTKIGFRRVVVV